MNDELKRFREIVENEIAVRQRFKDTHGYEWKDDGKTMPIPKQHDAFDAVIDEMRSIYRAKSAAYGPKPIQRTGAVGVLHRIIDKTERLAVLMGDTAADDNGESIDDTLMDLANYAVIMMIVRRGEWGK